MEECYDLVVIGAGPGGYVAAIKAAKMGLKTAIVENREVGGTCLNRGCIPTKTLMHSSHLYYEAQYYKDFGVELTGLHYDLNKIHDRKEEVVLRIRNGVSSLLKGNGVTIIPGTATIMDNHSIQLKLDHTVQDIKANKILIATGSKPYIPDIDGIHSKDVVTSDEILNKELKFYRKLIIIGGGVIGVEVATIYQELGCEVEILEAMDRILPTMDKEISQTVAMSLKKKGVKIHTKAKVVRISEEEGLCCEYEEYDHKAVEQRRITISAEGILISVGRKANTDGLFGMDFSVDMEQDKIIVDDKFETNVKDIYAIGDVIKGMQLAHAASAQGIAAVEYMCNQPVSVNVKIIPACIYTSPEIATVGMNEEEAKMKGYSVKIGKYPMLGNSKTMISKGERGFVKVICDVNTDKLLGAQLVCERATDMISEFVAAMVNGLTSKEMAAVIRPHPTFSEGVTEALEDIYGVAVHLNPKGK